MGQSLLGASWGAGAGRGVLGDPPDSSGHQERVWGNIRSRGGGRLPVDPQWWRSQARL